jgi:hypothetical protein
MNTDLRPQAKRHRLLLKSVPFWSRAPAALLIAAPDLPGLDLVRFRYIPAVDDFVADLSFNGHKLELFMDCDADVSLFAEQDVPAQTFEQVAMHLATHKVPWLQRLKRFREFERLYRKPAKATLYEKREAIEVNEGA